MDKSDEPKIPIEKDSRLHTAIVRAEAEVKRVRHWLANDPADELQTHPPKILKGNPASRTKDPSDERGAGMQSLVEELRNLDSEVKQWRMESRHNLEKKAAADKKGRVIATLSIIVAIVFGTIGLWFNMNKQAEKVGNKVKASQLVIVSPAEGAEVGIGQKVRGKTPFSVLNHYIVVRTVRTGSAFARSAYVSTDGTFSGDARFGDAKAGEDDEFTIRVLASKAVIPEGTLTEIPDDAVWSDFITVRRVRSTPVAATQIEISSPTDAAEVGPDITISGTTSVPNLNHYVVVTPTRIGTSFVQDQPAIVDPASSKFNGRARIGESQVGVGQQFTIRILATKSKLSAAILTNAPADAVFSNSVTILRKY